ncbi:hypothetical protein PS15p_212270 [Mucor circinelloides]
MMIKPDTLLLQRHLSYSSASNWKSDNREKKGSTDQNCHWTYHNIWIARQHMNSKRSLNSLGDRLPSITVELGTDRNRSIKNLFRNSKDGRSTPTKLLVKYTSIQKIREESKQEPVCCIQRKDTSSDNIKVK